VKDPLHGLRDADVFGRGEKYVVTSSSRWRYGSTTTPPCFVVPRSASDEELGKAVIDAIEGFTLMTEHLSDELVEAAAAELLATVGVKSRETFERGASLLHVEEQSGKWTVQPWGRQRGYWIPLHEGTYIKVNAPSAADVGAAIRNAFVSLHRSA